MTLAERLADAAEDGILDLEDLELKAVPEEVRGLRQLSRLSLKGLPITTLPPWLAELPLTVLNLAQTGIRSLPPVLRELRGLEVLIAHENRLTALPDWLGELPLKSLWIGANPLRGVPEVVWRIQGLTTLGLHALKLRALPDRFGALPLLERLYAEENALTDLPPSLGEAPCLSFALLHQNPFGRVPPALLRARALREAHLDQTGLSSLELAGHRWTSLRVLQVSGHPGLRSLPEDIGELEGLWQLAAYGTGLDDLPAQLAACPLGELGLGSAPVCAATGSPPEVIWALSGLRFLDLSDTGLTTLPESIGRLAGLQRLRLAANAALEALPTALGALSRLRSLDLQDTSAQGSPLVEALEARGVYVRAFDWHALYANLYAYLQDAGSGSRLGDAKVAKAFLASRKGAALPPRLAPWGEVLSSLQWILSRRGPHLPPGTLVAAEVALGLVAQGGGDWSALLHLLSAAEDEREAEANALED